METIQTLALDGRMTMHVYGDSILKGIILDEDRGQYVPMKQDDFAPLCEKYAMDVVNKSKFGYTIGRGWALMSRALQNAAEKNTVPCRYMVLEYGGNDCNFDWKAVSDDPHGEHMPMTTLAAFTDTMKHIISVLREHAITPILVSLPPIHAVRYLNHIVASTPGTDKARILSWLGGDAEMIYRYQELYSSVVTRTAYEMNCMYVDLRSAFLDKHNYMELLCRDGIHPNEKGHALIADAFLQMAEQIGSTLQRQTA